MMSAIDSMTEDPTVVDDQGRLLLRRPAVRRLLGFYGLLHTDGRPAGRRGHSDRT
jgi:hypothetical protein